jgi:PAS domain S-box-containing protein
LQKVSESRQFGNGPWHWIGLEKGEDNQVIDADGRHYLMHQTDMESFSGWKIYHLRNTRTINQTVSGPLLSIAGPVVLLICVFIGASVLLLYKMASREIMRRRSAEQALRHSEERHRALYHHTPAMLHSVDTQSNLLSVSDFWTETMGYTRQEVLGRPVTDFFSPESRKHALENGLPRFFKEGTIKDMPYRLVKKNGEVIDVLLSAVADRDPNGRIQRSLAVSVDITERNKVEAALRQAKEELSRYSRELEQQVAKRTREIGAILRYTPAAVHMKDPRGRYLMVNAQFEKLFGLQGQSVRGKTDSELLPDEVAVQFGSNDQKVLSEGHSLHVEEQIPQNNGLHTYLSVKFPIYDESGMIGGMCGIATDITAEKNAREQLRRLSGSILASQEKERTALARELHDELGQMLTALRLDAAWLLERLKRNDTTARERAAAICDLVDTTIEEVRTMAISLRPGVLDDLGLVEALEWLTTEFERRTRVVCIFSHESFPAVAENIATAAYRIAQEALTNITRHAEATHVDVSLKREREKMILIVSDNGRGFISQATSGSTALGLAGMRERAVLVGGHLDVHSQSGQGTQVRFEAPFTPHS